MPSHFVSIAKGEKPYGTTRKALEGLDPPRVAGLRVLLKPNTARMLAPSSGATTHPQVVAAAIDYFKELGAAEVAVGESPITGVQVSEAFELCGIKEIAQVHGSPLLDFDAEPFQIIYIPNGRVVERIKVTWFWLDYDFVVSIPVMKTHMHTGVTLSLKNMKGMLWRRQKVAFHQMHAPEGLLRENEKELDLAIADMSSVLYPHMAIIDGIIGMEGLGPGAGQPKAANLIVAGHDAIAADWVGCRLMGIDPQEVAHLRLAAKGRGFDPHELHCTPSDYEKWIAPFARPPEKISFRYPGVTVHDCESCSACQHTLYLFLERYHHRLRPALDSSGPLHLALGKGVKDLPPETIFVGNCACRLPMAKQGIRIVGCPPVSSQIWDKCRPRE
ncbi:MAG: DUF362 domain-containing protein [Desulfarculaceae bacterium]|jgi:uncharacterized protein (DUF362 family)